MKRNRNIRWKNALAGTALGIVLAIAGLAAAPRPAQALVKLGVLTCTIEGGTGMVLYSSKRLSCTYRGATGKITHYTGRITRVGIDLGQTWRGKLAWLVFAVGDHRRGTLEGTYVGASAEATVGGGIGANALIGGFRHNIVLQPVSVQGQTGVNLAAGVAGLTLERG